jgi:hypothetical protein
MFVSVETLSDSSTWLDKGGAALDADTGGAIFFFGSCAIGLDRPMACG